MTKPAPHRLKCRKVKALLVREMEGLKGDDFAIEWALREMSQFVNFDNIAFEVNSEGKLIKHFRTDIEQDGQRLTFVQETKLDAHLKERIETRLLEQGFTVLQNVDDVQYHPDARPSAESGAGDSSPLVDTVLIWERTPGVAGMRFCTSAEADVALDLAKACGGVARMITVEDKMGSETFYHASPELRSNVDSAVREVQLSLDARDAMNRHGLPHDRELRIAVYRTIMDMRSLALFEAFNPGASRTAWGPINWPASPDSSAALPV